MADIMLTAFQPLSPGARPAADAPAPIHRHIPGSTLRGALAARWLAENGYARSQHAPREEFLDTFERNVHFGPLFAAGSTVVPLSVLRCKYRSSEECSAHYYDQALVHPPEKCPSCDGPLEPSKGEVEFFGSAAVDTTLRSSHVELTDNETAKSGILFTRQALNSHDISGQARTFHGHIHGASGWLLDEHTVFVGGARSTQGQCHYQVDDIEDRPAPAGVEDHLVVRLIAPGIFVDDAGLPSPLPNMAALSDSLGASVTLEQRWVRGERVGGWHEATGLPKPEEHAVTAGSSYLLRVKGTLDREGLRQLRNYGIGLRRTEGFGAVEIGPWHPPAPPAHTSQDSNNLENPGAAEHIQFLRALDLSPTWMVGELKNQLARRATGGSAAAYLLDRPRLQQLSAQQRERLRTVLEETSLSVLATVIDQLDGESRGVQS